MKFLIPLPGRNPGLGKRTECPSALFVQVRPTVLVLTVIYCSIFAPAGGRKTAGYARKLGHHVTGTTKPEANRDDDGLKQKSMPFSRFFSLLPAGIQFNLGHQTTKSHLPSFIR